MDIEDHEFEACWEEGSLAAESAWGPLGSPVFQPCPYLPNTPQADAWWSGFNATYARNNGY